MCAKGIAATAVKVRLSSYRPVATLILQHGTLRCGDVLVAGNNWGRVRAMLSDQKRPLECATPSMPVLTVGWRDIPISGEECLQVRG